MSKNFNIVSLNYVKLDETDNMILSILNKLYLIHMLKFSNILISNTEIFIF